MKKLAIIGSGEFQEPLVLKANELGYETYVFSKKNNTKAEKEANYFYDIDIFNKDEILKICKKVKIDGITTIASDITTNTVTYIAEKMNLIGNSSSCLIKSTNKYEMRKAFQSQNLIVPKFYLVTNETKIEQITGSLKFPLVVKPTDRAGSRGVTKVDSFEDLNYAVKCAMKESFSKNIIVEEYIEGEEYSCECISINGCHQKLAFTKKFTTGFPHFVETGHIQPVDFNNDEEIIRTIYTALDSLEIKNGASHTEFKIDSNNNIVIIETGARMAGDCIGSHLTQLSTGIDYVRLVIDVALGNEIDLKFNKSKYSYGIKFICNKNDYNYFKELETKYYNNIIYRSTNMNCNVSDINNSSNRGGWYIIKSDNIDLLKKIFSN